MSLSRRPVLRPLPALLALALVAAALFTAPACRPSGESAGAPQPPRAEIVPKELTIHGHTRVDNYYWLAERDNPKVVEYLKAENDYLTAVMKHTEPLQQKLYDEIIGRIKQTDLSVPYRKDGYYYYTRLRRARTTRSTAARRAASRRPKRSCSTSTTWPRATATTASPASP